MIPLDIPLVVASRSAVPVSVSITLPSSAGLTRPFRVNIHTGAHLRKENGWRVRSPSLQRVDRGGSGIKSDVLTRIKTDLSPAMRLEFEAECTSPELSLDFEVD